jgi:hypothetical protein
MEINVSSQAWHTLGIAARDDRLTIFFDGRELFVATDRRVPGPPAKLACGPKPTARPGLKASRSSLSTDG